MSLIRINAAGRTPVPHGGETPLLPTLTTARDGAGPITIMLHGYKFHPHDALHCPHTHIFAFEDVACRKAISWPRALGFDADTKLGIAFGWNARGTLKQALRSAGKAARALATLITHLRHIAPHRPVHLIGHSMGGYVALKCLRFLAAGDVGRIITLNAAVFQGCARRAMDTPAGQRAELFNVVSGENAVYDYLLKRALRRNDDAIGRGFSAPNALTIRLENRTALGQLADIGYPIAPPKHWYCHWSTYLRPGVFDLYAAILTTPERTPLPYLQSLLDSAPMPAQHSPDASPVPLPQGLKQAS